MSSNIINQSLKEIVLTTTEALGLSQPYVVEKDYYVIKAITALTTVQNDCFELIFQGGTALAENTTKTTH